MTKEEVISLFKQTRAFLEGHFQLSSGLHSPHYFQCARVLQYPKNCEILCSGIANHFRDSKIDAVVGPALGGIVVAQEVGRQLHARTMFAERVNGTMQLRRGFECHNGERVLVCEDVLTTGGSVNEVIALIKKHNASLVGVGAIVDRSGGRAKLENLFAVIHIEVITYKPEECPLCNQAVPVEKPGSRYLN